jgi:hypothetical protein
MSLMPDLSSSDDGVITVSPNASPLEFLQAVYRCPTEPMARRLRAAIEALGYVHPKLSATYAVSEGFGDRLERRLERARVIEHQPEPDR